MREWMLYLDNSIHIHQVHPYCREPLQAMRVAGREPAGGEIPVELANCQPPDDFQM